MEFRTRRPTGVQSAPVILLAGIAGAGKTWSAVEMSAMESIDRCFFIEIGEGVADVYGKIPDADFEIIVHDGSIGQVRAAIQWAAHQPAAEGKHNALILDSLTEIWDLIKDDAQAAMMQRVQRKGRKLNGAEPKPDMDLWNRAAETSDGIMRQLMDFPGPVVATARIDEVTSMGDDGKPVRGKAKEWKIQVQKKVPYRVSAIVEARAPRQWTLTKIVTVSENLRLEEGQEKPLPGFTVARLLEGMGAVDMRAASTFQDKSVGDELSDDAAESQNKSDAQRNERAQYVNEMLSYIHRLESDSDAGSLERGVQKFQSDNDAELLEACQKALSHVRASQDATNNSKEK
ncbi:AAA family ATPase [Corynebacterium pseudodiphtheriticum]|uniref:AAA family ATPase n=1 Tax=Corynebacterium pseudodiphtheriticum TaxID=37637 RepID=UPI00254BCEE5|nr:AAA family ATPase [Corynebacterium pseudodiphtheriticum]MDK8500682.1 AAA family ATPase [Corynebacterium pseudodiphtheriticum]MDK8775758.1 AAA family ATPase [Corynebacterium pseudodiphtheriticum]